MINRRYPDGITEEGKKFLDQHSRTWQPGDDDRQRAQVPELLKRLNKEK